MSSDFKNTPMYSKLINKHNNIDSNSRVDNNSVTENQQIEINVKSDFDTADTNDNEEKEHIQALITKKNNIPLVQRNVDLEMLLQCNIIVEDKRYDLAVVNPVILCSKLDVLSLLIVRIIHNVPTTIGIVDNEFTTVNSVYDLLCVVIDSLLNNTSNHDQKIILEGFKSIFNEINLNYCRLFIIPSKVFNNWLDNAVLDESTYDLSYALHDFVNRYTGTDKEDLNKEVESSGYTDKQIQHHLNDAKENINSLNNKNTLSDNNEEDSDEYNEEEDLYNE